MMTDTFKTAVDMYTHDISKLSSDLKKHGYTAKVVSSGQQRLYNHSKCRLINTCGHHWREFVTQVLLLKRKGDIDF